MRERVCLQHKGSSSKANAAPTSEPPDGIRSTWLGVFEQLWLIGSPKRGCQLRGWTFLLRLLVGALTSGSAELSQRAEAAAAPLQLGSSASFSGGLMVCSPLGLQDS